MVEDINVYLLDDDNSARKGLSRLLRAAGFNALSFPDVSSFLNVVEPKCLGPLVTDLRMPGLSVEELAKELKKRNLNIDIIVVTGDDTTQSKKIANNIGAVGFFRKPVDGTALIDAINWSLKINKEKYYIN
jgi:FixJ family two-component response regulator